MIKGYSGANEIICMAKVFGNASPKTERRKSDEEAEKKKIEIGSRELKMNLSVHSPIRN